MPSSLQRKSDKSAKLAVPKFSTKGDALVEKREEKASRQFKQVLQDAVTLLRSATDTETVTLYWVNHQRQQFVLESKSTKCKNTMFQDRIAFDHHFLSDYRFIEEITPLEVGRDIPADRLKHYYQQVPVRFLTLLPFVSNGETVAITVLESKFNTMTEVEEAAIESYMSALGNLLLTYLELSDLSDSQNQWIVYEGSLEKYHDRLSPVQMFTHLIADLGAYLQKGGVTVLFRNLGEWRVVMNHPETEERLPIGLAVEEHTLAWQALQSGTPQFAIHFNSSPKRIALRESVYNGASLAIPVLHQDQRHALILVYDENPLIFKESTKHMMINTVRTAMLKMAAAQKMPKPGEELFSNQFQALNAELWEVVVEEQIEQQRTAIEQEYAWLGLITPAQLSNLRSQLRLEELKFLQSQMIDFINPGHYNLNGLIGHHSDYVYAFVLQGKEDDLVKRWAAAMKKDLAQPVVLGSGKSVMLDIHIGFTTLDGHIKDAQQALGEAKTALSHAVKNPDVLIYEF